MARKKNKQIIYKVIISDPTRINATNLVNISMAKNTDQHLSSREAFFRLIFKRKLSHYSQKKPQKQSLYRSSMSGLQML